MRRHQVVLNEGAYALETSLDASMRGLLDARAEAMGAQEIEIEGIEEWGDEEWELAVDGGEAGEGFVDGPCWWFQESGCGGEVECGCGPVTLLEVLGSVRAEERAAALGAHMQLLGELWSHFWSGQALVEGGTASIGDACAECIVDGHPHVYGVFADATQMAEELGEALAAFECSVTLHGMRWENERR